MSQASLETLVSFWVAIAVFGFTGSLHCAGMCGPLAALTCRSPQPTKQMFWYYLSRCLAYAVLGGMAGFVGQLILKETLNLPGRSLAVFLGGSMVVYAAIEIARACLAHRQGTKSKSGAVYLKESEIFRNVLGLQVFSRWMQTLVQKIKLPQPVALGLLTAVLPCGFLYAALAQAVLIGNPAGSAVAMGIFAIATGPALMLGSLGAAHWQKTFPKYAGIVSSSLLLLASLAFLYRGLAQPHEHHHSHESMEEHHHSDQ